MNLLMVLKAFGLLVFKNLKGLYWTKKLGLWDCRKINLFNYFSYNKKGAPIGAPFTFTLKCKFIFSCRAHLRVFWFASGKVPLLFQLELLRPVYQHRTPFRF